MKCTVKNSVCHRLPWWRSGWETACQCRGHGFDPWSGKIPQAAEQLSPWATTTEPTCHNYWSPCAYSPCSATREATAMRSLHAATKSSPHLPQLEKGRTQQWRPNAAKKKIKKKFSMSIFIHIYMISGQILSNIQFIYTPPPNLCSIKD